MAEKIGFINFTAFELHRANEFDAIKTRLYHADRPARSFYDIHPSLPPWRQLSLQGLDPMVRKTPAQLMPLMNEYHQYYLDKTVQHEMYLRWWKRHHAWHKEAQVFFRRFDELRDHLNEVHNREAYIQQGRLNLLLRQASEKRWNNTEAFETVRERTHDHTQAINAKMLARSSQHHKLVTQVYIHEPDQHRLNDQAYDRAQKTGEHYTRQELHPPHNPSPRWAKILAIADYHQKIQMPLPQAMINTHPETVKP
ncbi:MAG: hypothetical protein EOP10_34460, partial [Proteobacteria bacterium]